MKRAKRQWSYVGFENAFWDDPAINLTQKAIVAVLATWAGLDHTCSPTTRQIMARSGMGERALYSHLKTLEKEGFIRMSYWSNYKKQTRRMFTLLAPCRICMWLKHPTAMQNLHDKLNTTTPTALNVIQLPPPAKPSFPSRKNAKA